MWLRKHWAAVLGAALLLWEAIRPVRDALRVIFEWVGDLSLLSEYRGVLTRLLGFMANPPPAMTFIVILGGLGLIWWDLKRKNSNGNKEPTLTTATWRHSLFATGALVVAAIGVGGLYFTDHAPPAPAVATAASPTASPPSASPAPTPAVVATAPPLAPPGTSAPIRSERNKDSPTDQGNMEIGHVRLLYDKDKGEIKKITNDPRISNVVITKNTPLYSGIFSSSISIIPEQSQFWTIRVLFPNGEGIIDTKISGDAILECNVSEAKDNYVSITARAGVPYGQIQFLNPQAQSSSGELNIEFYR